MSTQRPRALQLRIAGKSYNEIRKEIKVSKSTLSLWLRDTVLSEKARIRLNSRMKEGSHVLIKRNKLQTKRAEERAKAAQQTGKQKIRELKENDLLIIGTVLYWAEGYKRLKIRGGKERVGHTISFVNSDAKMISVFVRFLREALAIPAGNIRLNMRLYDHINEEKAREYWTQAAGLSSARFFKTTYLVSGASKGIRPHNRLPWGTLQVEVCDTQKFHYILGLIEGVKEKLLHDKIPTTPR